MNTQAPSSAARPTSNAPSSTHEGFRCVGPPIDTGERLGVAGAAAPLDEGWFVGRSVVRTISSLLLEVVNQCR